MFTPSRQGERHCAVANVFGVTGYVVMAGISGAELDVETFAADGKAANTPFYVAVLC